MVEERRSEGRMKVRMVLSALDVRREVPSGDLGALDSFL